MQKSDSDQARLAAAREILDRAYGKPQQAIVGDRADGSLTVNMTLVFEDYIRSLNQERDANHFDRITRTPARIAVIENDG